MPDSNDAPHATEAPATDRAAGDTPAGTAATDPNFPAGVPGFEVGELLGRGGMGVVYAARDLELGRRVAVKLLRPEYASAPDAARRFVEEARITGQLQHPGIPAVYRVGRRPDGTPFLAMKLVHGDTLAEMLRDRPNPGVDRGKFLAAFAGICQAVGYAHAQGVIHRDLKPANAMVGTFGEVQVMDWGLAKVSRAAELGPRSDGAGPADLPDAERTAAGSVLGTPAYMPPEQALGDIAKVDARSDVFGLGGILCAILTGQPPYVGDGAESTRRLAARADLDDAFARLDAADAEPGWVALCKRCLAADPPARPPHGAAVADEVARLRDDAADRARRADIRLAATDARRKLVGWSAAAVLATALVGTGVSVWQAGIAHSEARNAGTAAAAATAAAALAEERERDAHAAEGRAVAEQMKAIAAAELARKSEKEAREAETDRRLYGDFLVENVLAARSLARVQGDGTLDIRLTDGLAYAEEHVARTFFLRPVAAAGAYYALGVCWKNVGRYDRAEPHLTKSLAIRDGTIGPNHQDTLDTVELLGELYYATRDYGRAEALLLRAKAGYAVVPGPAHRDTLDNLAMLGHLYRATGKAADAEALYRQALAGQEKHLGRTDEDTLSTLGDLAALLCERGRGTEALPYLDRYFRGLRGNGVEDRELGNEYAVHSLNLLRAGQYAAAETYLRKCLDVREKLDPDGWPAANARSMYGEALAGQAKYAQAEKYLLEGYAGLKDNLAALPPAARIRPGEAAARLVALYDATSKPAEAARWRAESKRCPPEQAPAPRRGK